MIKKLVFIPFVFVACAAMAQVPVESISADVSVFPKETVALTVNSEILLAGELLQYKVYVQNASKQNNTESRICYVSFRNLQDSIVFNHKLKVEEGTANGDFFLPSNLKTGIYKLIGYTNFSKNNPVEAFAQTDIHIINTFQKYIPGSSTQDTITLAAETKIGHFSKGDNSSEGLEIILSKKIFGPREKVSVGLSAPSYGGPGKYCVSVRKINPVKIVGKAKKVFKANTPQPFFVPEIRGAIVSGLVVSKTDGSPEPNVEVALTIPGKNFIYKIAKTNADGRFFFSVAEAFDSEKSIVQLFGSQTSRNDYKVVLDPKHLHLAKNGQAVLKLNNDLKDWLQERSVQLQIENAYFEIKKDSILEPAAPPPFYNDLGTVYNLDDYTRFPRVRETFIEVVTLAAIRGRGANAKFVVNNPYDPDGLAKFNAIDPLVLMDGTLIQDNEELLNYNAREIDRIRVINEPYRYGPKLFSGIIAIETKTGNFVPKPTLDSVAEINFQPLERKKSYYRPDYGNEPTLSKIPDYRVQLLWEPNITFAKEGFSATFYTSDVVGTYEISVTGYSASDVYVSEKTYFEVAD